MKMNLSSVKNEWVSWIYCLSHSCSYYEKLIVSACYDEISPEEQMQLNNHLQQCPKCKTTYEDLIQFTNQLAQFQNEWNVPCEEELNIDVFSLISPKIKRKEPISLTLSTRPLKLAYSLGFIILLSVAVTALFNVYMFKENPGNVSSSFTSLLTKNSVPKEASVEFVDGPLEGQKEKLREIIKTHRGQSIAGQALLLLANMEFTSSEHYEEAYKLYSQLRTEYPQIFSSSPEAIYRYNLLAEAKQDQFKPLYEINTALVSNDNPIKRLEKVISKYPGTMIAQLAVSHMVECVGGSSSEKDYWRTVKALENLKTYLTEPTAIAQVNYTLGNLYWHQLRDFEKARISFQSIMQSETQQLYPLANEALTQLVSFPEN